MNIPESTVALMDVGNAFSFFLCEQCVKNILVDNFCAQGQESLEDTFLGMPRI